MFLRGKYGNKVYYKGDHPRFCVKGRDKKFIYMTNPIESFNRNMRKYWSFFIDYEIFLIQIEKKIGFIQT